MKADPATPSCTACGAQGTRKDPFYYDWKDRRHWVFRCARCTHQFVYPPVTKTDQDQIYSDTYFSAGGDWVCGLFGKGYKDSQPELREEAAEVLSLIPLKGGSLLDIGCAGGVFLHQASKRGFAVQGIEINECMAEYARATFGVPVVNERIEGVSMERWAGQFDVVTLLDVLEHIPDPHATLAKARSWVRDGGFLLIRGPLSNSPAAHLKEAVRRRLGVSKRLPGYPLDANMFNKRSLTALLNVTGFTVSQWWAKHDFANLLAIANGASSLRHGLHP